MKKWKNGEQRRWRVQKSGGETTIIYSVFLLLLYFLFRQNLGGGPWPPGLPASGAPGKREQVIQWVGGEHLLGYSFMYVLMGQSGPRPRRIYEKKGRKKILNTYVAAFMYCIRRFGPYKTVVLYYTKYVLQPAPLYCSPLAASTGWPTKLRQCVCFENESHQIIIRNVKLSHTA